MSTSTRRQELAILINNSLLNNSAWETFLAQIDKSQQDQATKLRATIQGTSSTLTASDKKKQKIATMAGKLYSKEDKKVGKVAKKIHKVLFDEKRPQLKKEFKKAMKAYAKSPTPDPTLFENVNKLITVIHKASAL